MTDWPTRVRCVRMSNALFLFFLGVCVSLWNVGSTQPAQIEDCAVFKAGLAGRG